MIRQIAFAFLMVALLPLIASAEDGPKYSVHATATQVGKEVLIKIAIMEEKPGLTAEVKSRPYVKVNEGERAQIVMGNLMPQTQPSKQTAEIGKLSSGYRVDLISIKGQDKVLIVTDVVENSATVWAEAVEIPVVVEAVAK